MAVDGSLGCICVRFVVVNYIKLKTEVDVDWKDSLHL